MAETEANVITWTEAAEQKGVHRSTLYRAAERGEINTARFGEQRAILNDEAFKRWEPQQTGRRASNQSSNQ